MPPARTQFRRSFFEALAQRLPELGRRLERGNESSRWLSVTSRPIIVAHYLSADSVGIFVRAERGAGIQSVKPFLQPRAAWLAQQLETEFERKNSKELLWRRIMLDMADKTNWPMAIAWFAEWSPKYEAALKRL